MYGASSHVSSGQLFFTIEHITTFLVDRRKSIFLGDRLQSNVSYHVLLQLHGVKTSVHAVRTLVWFSPP